MDTSQVSWFATENPEVDGGATMAEKINRAANQHNQRGEKHARSQQVRKKSFNPLIGPLWIRLALITLALIKLALIGWALIGSFLIGQVSIGWHLDTPRET